MAAAAVSLELWHLPRCSTSRAAAAALDARGADYRVRLYLDDPPTAAELDAVLRALGMEPWDLARPREAAERGLADLPRDRDTWIAAMIADPIVIQRPVLVAGDGRAALGRPADAMLDLLPERGPVTPTRSCRAACS